jgi:hypothetical protein
MDSLIWWNVPRLEMSFPVKIGKAVSPLLDVLVCAFIMRADAEIRH